mmetsp:Transcript_12816/g.19406  ORF Transcript_12816/g.19406 Transcript_12816/m.19406 type:complete len:160 (-) Transcript_12816:74-553(-)|eukprot:CAMPEP_0201544652 /NCGR_PEP_ID=MMETSP0173_2-20130828/1283_1 /ASSEMBLY_ACC=CAM_ASM_000268 /TAXON_ID=218659 /ORGANISM="Vexillifera sp., Strain DIVA3 564/2" /LENGTH=159 /DNA_ID=CAMNT_0047952849 /DNA_START=74 /DNA_END=553 /DNA_ORIENTATION=-
MADLTLGNQQIHDAYEDILKDDGGELNWFIFSGSSGNWAIESKGGAGLDEMKAALANDKVQYVVFKAAAVDTDEGVTTHKKLGLATWVGPDVEGVQRRKVLGQKQEIRDATTNIHIHLSWDDSSDVTMEEVGKACVASQGSHKPTYITFGEGHKYNVPK